MDEVLMLCDSKWVDCHLKDYLKISGYKITESNIDDGIESFKYMVLFKDIVLIVCINPQEYFDAVSALRNCTEIPIMVISRTGEEWAKIKMFQLGADDYIAEPFQEMAMIARMQARIEQFRRLTRLFGYIKVRDLAIEALSRKVFIRGEEVIMSVKEFDVLLYLAQHANSAVSRDELYYAVWKQHEGNGVTGSVTTYVKKVREKIEEDPDNPQYIETVWGVGYRFVK